MSERFRREAESYAAAFLFTHDLFLPPSFAQWAFLNDAKTCDAWSALAEPLGLPAGIHLPRSAAAYESEYIAAFDAGAPHPPVPLFESHYNKRDPVPRILHENILFYQAFGLRLKAASNETADHLLHQLEFVAYLWGMEVDEMRGPEDAHALEQTRSARHDFVGRHMMSWLPSAEKSAGQAPWPWVRNVLALAARLAEASAGST